MACIFPATALGPLPAASLQEMCLARVFFRDAAACDQRLMRPEDVAEMVRVREVAILQPDIDLLNADKAFPRHALLLIIASGVSDRLTISGREHAYLVPTGKRLPFAPKDWFSSLRQNLAFFCRRAAASMLGWLNRSVFSFDENAT